MQHKMSGIVTHASQDALYNPDRRPSNASLEEDILGAVSAEDTEEEATLKAKAFRAAVAVAAQ